MLIIEISYNNDISKFNTDSSYNLETSIAVFNSRVKDHLIVVQCAARDKYEDENSFV